MGNRADQVDDALTGLESETASDLARTLSEYTVRDITAAVARRVLDAGEGGGGLPTGWTQDEADPANVDSNGGALDLGETSLTVGSLILAGARTVQIISDDPTGGGGSPAPIGSFALRTNGQAWLKTGAAATDWTQLGGVPAGSIKTVRFPVTYDMAGLQAVDGSSTGVVAYTPVAGEAIIWSLSYFSVPSVGFDSATPVASLHLTFSDLDGAFFYNSLTGGGAGVGATDPVDGTITDLNQPLLGAAGSWIYTTGANLFPNASPLRIVIDDDAGGAPGLEAGEGVLVLFVAGL